MIIYNITGGAKTETDVRGGCKTGGGVISGVVI